MNTLLMQFLGALAIFLFAIANLSEIVSAFSIEKMRDVLERFASNVFLAILFGFIATVILDSSSAVIIITIVLANANILSLRQTMGIVLGANVGTTISSQILSLDLGKIAPFVMLGALFLMLIFKKGTKNMILKLFLMFGLLFFSMFLMELSVEPLKKSSFLYELMQENNPTKATLLGAFTTVIIQSSSATVVMAMLLVKKSVISLSAGVAVMLGAELGTVSDTLFATLGGTRRAIKTGIFHLLFNLISIILGLLFFYPFIDFVKWVSSSEQPEKILANAHFWFNTLGLLAFAWFVPFFEKALNTLIPEKTKYVPTA
ncbi:MAG: Na/Pi symporter [Thermonemataceae bacterium]|nr:Na/Pi symporter [Thermonemataceae bacterium]